MIEVKGLTKDYGPNRAIDSLSFHVGENEILGFLGPNGAGKTTTIRILCGYMPATSGKASISGYDVIDQSLEVRRRVGYLPESNPLYPDMTLFDYLNYMANLRRTKNAEERVNQVIKLMNLEDRSDSYISSLSKGLKQRAGLAQSLVHDPEVLILDEPTIGLDPAQIIEVRNLIQDLGKTRTILLSTHILSEAQQVCDRVLIINRGKLVAEDSPERLKSRISGAQHIFMEIGGNQEGIESHVRGVNGVNRILSIHNGILEIETLPGSDPRPDLAKAVVSAGYDLLEIRKADLSLEEIFLKLTREERDEIAPNMNVQADSEGDGKAHG